MTNVDLPDVNVLFALLQPAHVAHPTAMQWFATVGAFATTPVTELGVLRLALNPKVMGTKLIPSVALAAVSSIRADPRATFLADSVSLNDPMIDLRGLAGHRQVTDLHLVELAARHSMVLVTLDQALPLSLLEVDQPHVRLLN